MNDILAVDIGNTSVFFAHFSGQRIKKSCRIATHSLNINTLVMLKKKLFLQDIRTAVIASVVPQATHLLQREIGKKLGLKTYTIGKDFDAPIINRYKNPRQVGVDRLVNAAAAFDRYHRDAIVIDFGTAITFDIVSKKGEYLGGVIATGIEITLEALNQKTALLK